MKFLSKSKDGGNESNVTGYWLIEIKPLFTIALLKFEQGTRDAYHSHAFNCISWLLKGKLQENLKDDIKPQIYISSLIPIITKRETFHKVFSHGTSWVLTFRGPWTKQWKEVVNDKELTLEHGRVIVNAEAVSKINFK